MLCCSVTPELKDDRDGSKRPVYRALLFINDTLVTSHINGKPWGQYWLEHFIHAKIGCNPVTSIELCNVKQSAFVTNQLLSILSNLDFPENGSLRRLRI